MNRRPNRMAQHAKVSLTTAAAAVCASLLSGASASAQVHEAPSTGDRVLGLDISAWQGDISQATWNNFYNLEDREFVFIRSSRGGTTGYYDQRNADNNPPTNTLSQRYDDPYYIQNITRATRAGLLAGSYHFSRPDIVAGTLNSNGIPNNGTDEADHFIQMAGPWMRPGFLLPVHDLEAGDTQRTDNQLGQFAMDFSNRIYDVMGIRPAIYLSGNYANILQNSTSSTLIPGAYPTLWAARWPNQTNPDAIQVQTAHPKDTYTPIYGPWDDNGTTHPWAFWQYASTGRLDSFNSGNSNLDFDVAQGDIEFVKDYLVPAVWMNDSNGNWSTLANWNSGQTPVAPVQGPGQVARVGALVLPTPRLPGTADPNYLGAITGADDTVILDRPNANITVTHSSGTHNFRRLELKERLNVTGGSLDARLTGWVGSGGTLSISGGNATFTDGFVEGSGVLDFAGSGNLNVGTLFVANNNTQFSGASGTGQILGKAGVASPTLNLTGGTRTFNVGDGSFITDMRVAIPLTNGSLIKDGNGTLELTGNNSTFNGNLTVARGYLQLTNSDQIGTNGVNTTQTDNAGTDNDFGGTVRLLGDGLNFNKPINIGGSGVAYGNSSFGALENIAGVNTWSGAIRLAGTGGTIGNHRLNQIMAFDGTTLNLNGVISNASGGASTWAKTGAGDVVLGGTSTNTYTGLTRVFGGRLIIEKNNALGASASDIKADGNTFQLGGVESTIAFRGGVNYTANEWIFTDGTGFGGGTYGQIDNLGGNNIYAGKLGLGGPSVDGMVESSIGVNSGTLELSGKIYAKSQTGPAARRIVKRGAGTLMLSGDSSGTPTNDGQAPAPNQGQAGALTNSTFVVGAGTVQLNGTAGNTANLPGVSTWSISNNAALRINKANAQGNAELVLNGGRIVSALPSLNFSNTVRTDSGGTGGIIDTSGAITLNGSLNNSAGKTLRKQGSGTWNISGPQSHGAGAAFINETGTTNFNSNAGSVLVKNLAVTINSGSGVNFNTQQHLNGLTIQNSATGVLAAGQDKMLTATGLAIGATGKLDLNDNDLLIDYAAGGPNPYGQVRQYVINGITAGTGGITSTTGSEAGDTILAVIDNSEIGLGAWNLESIDSSTLIGKYTYFGDANLDGKVTGDDYVAVDFHLGKASNARWYEGDFNHDGKITGDDYVFIDANLGKGVNDPMMVTLQSEMVALHTQMFGASYVADLEAAMAGDFTVVPEPATLSILAFTGLLLRRRRR